MSPSVLAQYASIALLFLAVLGCGIVVLIEIMHNQTPNSILLSMITLGLGNASTMLGYHQSSNSISTAQNKMVDTIESVTK